MAGFKAMPPRLGPRGPDQCGFEYYTTGRLTMKGMRVCRGQEKLPPPATWNDFKGCIASAQKGVPDAIECLQYGKEYGLITEKGFWDWAIQPNLKNMPRGRTAGVGQDAVPASNNMEAIEHAAFGAALVAAITSVIGCSKGWKLWTVGAGAALGAAGGYAYTKLAGAS